MIKIIKRFANFMNIKKRTKNEKIIKRVMPLLLLILVLGTSNSIYAETKEVTSDGITSEIIVEGLNVLSGEVDDEYFYILSDDNCNFFNSTSLLFNKK